VWSDQLLSDAVRLNSAAANVDRHKSEKSCVPPCRRCGGSAAPTGLLLLPLQPVGIPATYASLVTLLLLLLLLHQCLLTWCHELQNVAINSLILSITCLLISARNTNPPLPLPGPSSLYITTPSEFYSIPVRFFRLRKSISSKKRRHFNTDRTVTSCIDLLCISRPIYIHLHDFLSVLHTRPGVLDSCLIRLVVLPDDGLVRPETYTRRSWWSV